MQRTWIEHLACPRTGAGYDLDPVRVSGDEIVEAFLVSQDERDVRPVLAGVGILPADLAAHLREQGNVYRRSPVNDPRLARFLFRQAGEGYVVVAFDEVVSSYRDLAEEPPEGYDVTRPDDALALARLIEAARPAGGTRRALHVGCGVGRGVFDLAGRFGAAFGIDRNVACVRRARNVAVTTEHFFLPAPKGSGMKEIALDLSTLGRDGADFAVADGNALPFQDGTFDLVVLSAGDAQGTWADAAACVAEARRALAPGGVLVWHEGAASAEGAEASDGPWHAAGSA